MFEAKIIHALNESKKAKLECDDVDKNLETEEQDTEEEVKEEKVSDTEEQDVEEVDDTEECDDIDEVIRKVRDGKVVKLKKPPKKGFKVIDGKYVKMSSKEKMARRKAIKKAQRKAHSGAAKLARKKSMKLRARKNLDASFKFDEQAFQELMNASLNNIFESASEQYYSFTVESVDSAVFDGSNLVLECEVSYEDGVTATGTFTVEDFDYTSGVYNVLESSNLLDEIQGTMSVELVVEGAEVTPVEFSHDVTVNGEEISESFVFESVPFKKMNKADVYQSTMTEKLPSGASALTAEINDQYSLYVTCSTEEPDTIYVFLSDDYKGGGYYKEYSAKDEKKAVAQFMAMSKFIDPETFDAEEIADKYDLVEM